MDNTFARELPADPVKDNRRRQVRGACFSWVAPTPVAKPELVASSKEVADLLGIDLEADRERWARVLSGNETLDGMQTYAACYGGHQFGHWAGQLGDGRAISLGEAVGPGGARWELQLKGAGPTPYSRTADGRAVLRSSIREFLCSEAMHHLGVPTTRALSLVTTGEPVVRDMLYDGNARPEPGAIVCRVAPSFLRFGNYQIFASRGDEQTLKQLVDYTLRHHFPELLPTPDAPIGEDEILAFVSEVARRTAVMIVHWMRVGFVHGVMNTDNMSALGLTIDYGPYGWLDDYDPSWTPNTTDAAGRRYRYARQPGIALWNLARFAEALTPLFDEPERLEEAIAVYPETFNREHAEMLAGKLGFEAFDEAHLPVIEGLLDLLPRVETDMTLFFRRLARVADLETDDARFREIEPAYYGAPPDDAREEMTSWLRRYAEAAPKDEGRVARMNATNPKYVLRNYLAQEAIDLAEEGDPSRVRELLDLMRRPYDEQPERERFAAKRPDWARDRPGCSMLSCSS